MAKLKTGQLAEKHIQVHMRAMLKVHGIVADVYKQTKIDNIYEEIYPEFSDPLRFGDTIKVMLTDVFYGQGLNLDDYVSNIDKLDEEIILWTDYQLKELDKLTVTTDDGKSLKLQVLGAASVHSSSTLAYKFFARVV